MTPRKWAAAFAAMLTLGSPLASAQTNIDSGGTIIPGVYDKSYATKAPTYCQIVVTATATALSNLLAAAGCSAPASTAYLAYLTPELAASGVVVRYRADGNAPTASVGQPIGGFQAWPIPSAAFSPLSLISATGASIIVSVEYRG
jgi:hypothetical protein